MLLRYGPGSGTSQYVFSLLLLLSRFMVELAIPGGQSSLYLLVGPGRQYQSQSMRSKTIS